MLGSYDLNIYVTVDWESQWCYHARFLVSQYLCHARLLKRRHDGDIDFPGT
jgi:hypothetical protein